jgi:hypothetical protein
LRRAFLFLEFAIQPAYGLIESGSRRLLNRSAELHSA